MIELGTCGLGRVTLTDRDTRDHVAILGKVGMGKSTLALNCFEQLALQGEGASLIDSEKDTAQDGTDRIVSELPHISPLRRRDIIIVQPGVDDGFRCDLFDRDLTGKRDEAWMAKTTGLILDVACWKDQIEDLREMRRLRRIGRNVLYLCGTRVNGKYQGLHRWLDMLEFGGPAWDRIFMKLRLSLPRNVALDCWRIRSLPPSLKIRETESCLNLFSGLMGGPLMEQILRPGGPSMNWREDVRRKRIKIFNVGTTDELSQEQCEALCGFIFILEYDACDRERVRRHLFIEEAGRILAHGMRRILVGARRRNVRLWLINQGIAGLKNSRVDISDEFVSQPGVCISFHQRGRQDTEELGHMFGTNLMRFDRVWKPMDRPAGHAILTLPERGVAHTQKHANALSVASTVTRTTKSESAVGGFESEEHRAGHELGTTSSVTDRKQNSSTQGTSDRFGSDEVDTERWTPGIQYPMRQMDRSRAFTNGWENTRNNTETEGRDESLGQKYAEMFSAAQARGQDWKSLHGFAEALGLIRTQTRQVATEHTNSVSFRNHMLPVYREEWYPAGLEYDCTTQIWMVKQLLQLLTEGWFLMFAKGRRTILVYGDLLPHPFEGRERWGEFQVRQFKIKMRQIHKFFFEPQEMEKWLLKESAASKAKGQKKTD